MTNIKIGFIGSGKEVYEKLIKVSDEQKRRGIENSEERQILKSINQKNKLITYGIEINRIYGEKIQQKDIPRELAYLNSIWKVRLVGYWRMLYTIDNRNRPEVVAIILDIMNHNKYNKLFRR